MLGAATALLALSLLVAPATAGPVKNPTTNVGFCGGDDWEPEIAADHLNHVYVVLAHFPGDPTCDPASGGGREIFVRVSSNGGTTFGALQAIPRLGYRASSTASSRSTR